MRPSTPRPSGGGFHRSTLRLLAGEARRELDAHDGRARRNASEPADARARLSRAAQATQQRLVAAEARRRNRRAR